VTNLRGEVGVRESVGELLGLAGLGPFVADPAPSRLRCAGSDPGGGRCQLVACHSWSHAAAVVDAYLTWYQGALCRWSIRTPPHWLIDLPWAPGFQPRVQAAEARLPHEA
jgi:hypothetical protein